MSDIVEEFSYDNALSEAATEDLEDIVLKARAEGAVQERERLGIVLQVATGGAAALARAAEREACARLVEGIGASTTDDIGAAYVASAIRARGEAPKCTCDNRQCGWLVASCPVHHDDEYPPTCATCGDTQWVERIKYDHDSRAPCPDCTPKPDACNCNVSDLIRCPVHEPDARDLALTKERDDVQDQCAEAERAANDAELKCELALETLRVAQVYLAAEGYQAPDDVEVDGGFAVEREVRAAIAALEGK